MNIHLQAVVDAHEETAIDAERFGADLEEAYQNFPVCDYAATLTIRYDVRQHLLGCGHSSEAAMGAVERFPDNRLLDLWRDYQDINKIASVILTEHYGEPITG